MKSKAIKPISRPESVLYRLSIDARYRLLAILEPEKALASEALSEAEKHSVKSRIELVRMMGMSLAFQSMKDDKRLRVALAKLKQLEMQLFCSSNDLERLTFSVPLIEVPGFDKLRETITAVAVNIFNTSPEIDIEMGPGSVGSVGGSGCADIRCSDTLCGDNSCGDGFCSDTLCSDTQCENAGCQDEQCTHDDCSDPSCSHTDCSDSCPGDFEDGIFLSDQLWENLLENWQVDFLVHVDGQSYPAQIFTDPKSISKVLPMNIDLDQAGRSLR